MSSHLVLLLYLRHVIPGGGHAEDVISGDLRVGDGLASPAAPHGPDGEEVAEAEAADHHHGPDHQHHERQGDHPPSEVLDRLLSQRPFRSTQIKKIYVYINIPFLEPHEQQRSLFLNDPTAGLL